MKTQVITISSREPNPITEPYYYPNAFRNSAKRHGIAPHFLQELPWTGLMTKPKSLKKYLDREGASVDYVAVVDFWDLVWLSDLSEVMRKYALFDTPIVFNAERNCFPDGSLAEQHEPSLTPYRFLNSGFFIGTTEAVMEMLNQMEADKQPDDHVLGDGTKINPNDQDHYMRWMLAHKMSAALDTSAVLCQSLHATEDDEFTWNAATQRLTSRITGNSPCVLHGNGSGKAWLQKVINLAGL